jgi:hypothetical protein
MEYAEILYSLVALYIAELNADGSYDTPVLVANGQAFVYEPESDNDEMRGYGVVKEGLSVPIKAKVTLKGGGYDTTALAIMAGATATESGASGNRVTTVDVPAGGAGLGHFAIIGKVAAKEGQAAVLGLEKVMLSTPPSFTADGENNKFNNMDAEGNAYPVTVLSRLKRYEDATDFTAPTSGADITAFFA